MTYTMPTAGITTDHQVSVSDDVSGPNDWTQAADGLYSSGPHLPGIAGMSDLADTGAGKGTVHRLGRTG